MDQARRIAQKMAGVILAHYPNLDKEVVGEGWPLGLPDEAYEGFKAEATPLAKRMVTNTADELGLLDNPTSGAGPGDGARDAPLLQHGLLDSATDRAGPGDRAGDTPAQE